jgi:hypothetical protein
MADDEHPEGARITLEYNQAWPAYAITCGVYGCMAHTRFFAGEDEARREYAAMKDALAEIAVLKVGDHDPASPHFADALAAFQDRFP